MNIAVLPARGGSKRIPGKNVRDFCGRPMLARTIEIVRAARLFDRVIVSTDDERIAAVAHASGAEVPFARPAELADDHATTVAVIAHAVAWLNAAGVAPDAVCCVYPASPFLTVTDLNEGQALLAEGGWDYVIAAAHFQSNVYRALRVGPRGALQMLAKEFSATRTQDLPEIVYDAGTFYWGRASAWLAERPILGGNTTAVIIPRERAHDIDVPDDWEVAETWFRLKHPDE